MNLLERFGMGGIDSRIKEITAEQLAKLHSIDSDVKDPVAVVTGLVKATSVRQYAHLKGDSYAVAKMVSDEGDKRVVKGVFVAEVDENHKVSNVNYCII